MSFKLNPNFQDRLSEVAEQRGEEALDRRANALCGGEDHDRDEARDHGIFDRGRAGGVGGKTLQMRSRSMAMSGMSAAGIGYCAMSRGLTHFSAACSRATGIPSQRRQT